MKIKMVQQITGTRNGQRWPEVGEELTVPDAEGAELCAQGYAIPVAQKPEPEKRTTSRRAPKKDD